jgi:ubiquinone/menaquinone biosynthesis C-methylase UbiE
VNPSNAAPRDTAASPFRPAPGQQQVPEFDNGWVTNGAARAPFLSFVDFDPSVNWSDELEALHEEASRTHILDRWTRTAVIGGLGAVPRDAVVADVGCSTGFLLEDLRARHPDATLVGVDLISSGLYKAHRLVPSARLVHADACDLPLLDASVHGIVSANLLEHVPDDRRAIREFARVLRPGARAVIVVPAGSGTYDYYDRFLGHERRYARRELADKCSEAGLEPIADSYIASLLYPAFWAVKQRNRRVYAHLEGEALERRVTRDIERTNNPRIGELAWRLETLLVHAGLRLPFGIRSLVVARHPNSA